MVFLSKISLLITLPNKFDFKESEMSVLQTLLEVKVSNYNKLKPLENSKFPIIVFLPGSGLPAQSYSNIINEIVSHGYIVLGVNSFFVNGLSV